jgi:hypothetical protein
MCLEEYAKIALDVIAAGKPTFRIVGDADVSEGGGAESLTKDFETSFLYQTSSVLFLPNYYRKHPLRNVLRFKLLY